MSILCRTFVVFWDTKQRATKSKEEGEGKRTLHGGLGVFREADSGLLQNQWKLVPRVLEVVACSAPSFHLLCVSHFHQ